MQGGCAIQSYGRTLARTLNLGRAVCPTDPGCLIMYSSVPSHHKNTQLSDVGQSWLAKRHSSTVLNVWLRSQPAIQAKWLCGSTVYCHAAAGGPAPGAVHLGWLTNGSGTPPRRMTFGPGVLLSLFSLWRLESSHPYRQNWLMNTTCCEAPDMGLTLLIVCGFIWLADQWVREKEWHRMVYT
jgi:hypothetical protein